METNSYLTRVRTEQILAASKTLFLKNSFRFVTIKQIASQANLSVGSIYRYFKTKEDIHTMLCIDLMDHLILRFNETEKSNLPILTKIETFLTILIQAYDQDPDMLIHIIRLQSGDTLKKVSPDILYQLKLKSFLLQQSVINTMEEGIRKNTVVEEPPMALADFLWGIFSGCLLQVNLKNQTPIKNTLITMQKILISGIRRNQNTFL